MRLHAPFAFRAGEISEIAQRLRMGARADAGKTRAADQHVDAMGAEDTEKAMQVWRSDEAIDDIYNALFRELMTYMMEDPRNISGCTHLLFIAKNIERIGDHITNIAELIHYTETGQQLKLSRPKGDNTSFVVPNAPTGKAST